MELKIPPGDFAGYIFDCDGTLADSMPLHFRAWTAALKEHKAEFPEALFYEMGGTPTEQIVEMLNDRHGHKMPPKETAAYKESLYLELLTEIQPITPVVDFARSFAGKLPIAVASGGHRGIVQKTLSSLGILELFDVLVGAEDYLKGKPAPDPFLEAARRLGVEPSRCLVFEDTQLGIDAAVAAGMEWVHVPSAPNLPR